MPAAVPAHPAPDHHAPPVVARPSAAPAAGVETLRHAVELRAPRDVLLEALLGLLSDADALPAGLLAEPSDPACRRAFLLLRRRAEVQLGQSPDDHDLVVLDHHIHSREPAVREPSGKPTFDRTEFLVIHALHNYTVKDEVSRRDAPRLRVVGRSPTEGP